MKHSKITNRNRKYSVLLLFFTTLFFGGCASTPFGPVIEEDNRSYYEKKYAEFNATTDSCSQSFDGEISIVWQDALNNTAFSGFFQVLLPNHFRFSVLNPLGQPLYAATSNGTRFQAIDTSKHIFTTGSLRSYALLNDISNAFMSGSWGVWLSGRPLPNASHITGVYTDPAERGVWFSVSSNEIDQSAIEYVLLNPNNNKMMERIVLGENNHMEATISYSDWHDLGSCMQPYEIKVSGLSFGAQAQLKLADVREADLTENNFTIPIPPNYLRRIIP